MSVNFNDMLQSGKSPGADAAHDESLLYSEQVRQLYENGATGLVATLICAVGVAAILRDVVPHSALVIWLACFVLITMLRYDVLSRYRRAASHTDDAVRWGRQFMAGAALSGAAWGFASVFIFPVQSAPHQVFFALIIGGMVAGTAGLYSAVIGVFLLFSVPAIIPVAIRFFMIGGEIHAAMGGITLVFLMAMGVLGFRINAMTATSLRLRFENTSLISFLQNAKDHAEKLAAHLSGEIVERGKAEEELRKHKEHLEELVRARTSELTETNIKLQREIVQRREAEQELLKVQKLESLGILAGGIAHDYNNILTGILGNINLARMYPDQPERVSELLTEAENAALRARDLTMQLLTFSKGGIPVRKAMFIADMIMDAADFALKGSNVRCEFSIPDDLWPVEADPGQMKQVIHNLVMNAQQAMPDGGVIEVLCENATVTSDEGLPLKNGRYVKVSVQDHGIGIPKDHLGRIFDPYFTTKQKGSGFGLATSYSIIKNHDGYLTVESELGEGTVFYFYIPAAEREVSLEYESEGALADGTGRILVMDDEELVRNAARNILTATGYEVEFAEDGAGALELYKRAMNSEKPFDAVIMDLTIPGGMGGREAFTKLREIDPDVKAIVSSGYSDDPIMAKYSEYGFKGVVTKPYGVQDLISAVRRVLARHTTAA